MVKSSPKSAKSNDLWPELRLLTQFSYNPLNLATICYTTSLTSLTVAVHRGVMMADTLSFNAKIGVVDF